MSGAGHACRHGLATPRGVGAIAIVRVEGPAAAGVVAAVAPRAAGAAVGAIVHADFPEIDDGLVVRTGEREWRLMPHGGPAIVRRLLAALEAAGSSPGLPRPTGLDASAAATLARAASPAAVDVLAAQPARWRAAESSGFANIDPAELLARSRRLDRLVDPPTVVVAGRPNAGKSTLFNRLAGEDAARVSPEAGTTRDWVGRRLVLTPTGGDPLVDAVVVDACDTPGLRPAAGVEAKAIAIAAGLIARADLLIELVAPGEPRLSRGELPREPDLVVAGKADAGGAVAGTDASVSGLTGVGVAALADTIIDRLFPAADRGRLWAFDAAVRGRVPRR